MGAAKPMKPPKPPPAPRQPRSFKHETTEHEYIEPYAAYKFYEARPKHDDE